MACGCKDIEKDKEIIEYYNNKKKMEEQNTPEVHIITWQGSLCDYQMYIEDETLIVSILRQNGMWVATLEKQLNT